MIATWMLYGTLIAILAGVAALALERGARVVGVAGRWCWVGAMAVALALPVTAWVRPQALPPAAIRIPTPNGTVEATPPITITAPAITTHARPAWTWDDLDRPLVVGWGLLSLALVAWFGVGSWRLARLRRSWRSEGSLLISDNVGPAVVGFLRCHVVVPEWSLQLGSDQRELLLAHEAEHLATHDSRLLLLSAVVLALVPWNVGFWWQFRRLRLAIELDCDQRVLRKRPDPATYGRLLLDVGTRVTRTLMPVTAFYEPMSALERRIRSMTAKRPKGARILAAGTVLGAVAAIFFACEAPRPTAPPRQDVAAAKLSPDVDSLALLPWVREGLQTRWSELLAQKSGEPVDVWFFADATHRILGSQIEPSLAERGLPTVDQVKEVLADGPGSQSVNGFTTTSAHGWARSNVSIIWVTLRDSTGLRQLQERVERARASENAEPNEAEHREAERAEGGPSDQIRYQEAVRREGGMKVVAERYPQWVNQAANPHVTIWVVEGQGGRILSTHTSKQYTKVGSSEMLAELPTYSQLREGEWFSSFPLGEHRTDVQIVWMHSNRGH